MTNFLKKNGYWKAVAGEEENAEKNEKALLDINLAVDDNKTVYVESATTGKEAWENLTEVYENKGMANKMVLEEPFSTKKLKSGESAKTHIEEMKRLYTKLSQLGVLKSKEEYVMKLLRSLPRSYESLIMTLEIMVSSLSVEDIHARVLREESRQNNNLEEDSGSGNILQAKFDSRPFPHKCHYCQKKGHKINDCRKKKRDDSQKGYQQPLQSYQRNHFQMQKGKYPGEFLMARSQTAMTGKWYVDSGASFHMANSTIWFAEDSLETVSPIVIRFGDGT